MLVPGFQACLINPTWGCVGWNNSLQDEPQNVASCAEEPVLNNPVLGLLLHHMQSAAMAAIQQQPKVTGMVMQGFVGGAKASIDSVDAACQQVGSSQHLQGVLRAVLAVGNALNTGTARAQANGVKLDSLMKLADVKVNVLLSSTPAKSCDSLLLHTDVPSWPGISASVLHYPWQ